MSGYLSDRLPFDTSSNLLLVMLKWEKVSPRRKTQKALIMYKIWNVFSLNAMLIIIT